MEPVFAGESWGEHVLRPAFGSGEDWNLGIYPRRSICASVAPGLRVGRGLEREEARRVEDGLRRCARPSGRARIGTSTRAWRGRASQLLRPAFGSGEDWNPNQLTPTVAVPPLRPAFGSGEDWNKVIGGMGNDAQGCARPSGRARIGTP